MQVLYAVAILSVRLSVHRSVRPSVHTLMDCVETVKPIMKFFTTFVAHHFSFLSCTKHNGNIRP